MLEYDKTTVSSTYFLTFSCINQKLYCIISFRAWNNQTACHSQCKRTSRWGPELWSTFIWKVYKRLILNWVYLSFNHCSFSLECSAPNKERFINFAGNKIQNLCGFNYLFIFFSLCNSVYTCTKKPLTTEVQWPIHSHWTGKH